MQSFKQAQEENQITNLFSSSLNFARVQKIMLQNLDTHSLQGWTELSHYLLSSLAFELCHGTTTINYFCTGIILFRIRRSLFTVINANIKRNTKKIANSNTKNSHLPLSITKNILSNILSIFDFHHLLQFYKLSPMSRLLFFRRKSQQNLLGWMISSNQHLDTSEKWEQVKIVLISQKKNSSRHDFHLSPCDSDLSVSHKNWVLTFAHTFWLVWCEKITRNDLSSFLTYISRPSPL